MATSNPILIQLENSHEALFKKYQDQVYLNKVKEYARITIPTILPDMNNRNPTGNNTYEGDYQSMGSYLVSSLASKLARTLFPVGTTFFKIAPDPALEEMLKQQQKDSLIALANQACSRVFYNASYAQIVQALKLLVITGDVILKREANEGIIVYSMQSYGIKRNSVGKVLDCVICENKVIEELDEATIARCNLGGQVKSNTVKLYTRIKRELVDGIISWVVTQEINGVRLDYTARYQDKACPYIFVVWNLVNGDNYGHGHVEDNEGDLAKLSDLSYELTKYQLASTRVLNLVGDSSNFDIQDACEAETGDFVKGDPKQVTPFEFGDANKMQAIQADLAIIKQDLAVAFMYQGNTRNAERVTQFEIQQNAMEAEQVLGGVYSQLAQLMHLPLSWLLLNEVDDTFISTAKANGIDIKVLTGLQALNQVNDNNALVVGANIINQVVPVLQGVSKEYNISAIARMILSNQGVDLKQITYTEQELVENARQEQEAQAQQQQALIAQQQQAQLQAQQATEQSQGVPSL